MSNAAIIPIPFVGPPVRVKRKYVRKAKRPGQKGYTWSPQQRKRFLATAARKRKERELGQARKERATKPKARLSQEDRRDARRDDLLAVLRTLPPPSRPSRADLRTNTAAPAGRSTRTAGEERDDAIVYLTAATERIAHASDAELLALLALRRLQGRIK